jgi:hypothetical protein
MQKKISHPSGLTWVPGIQAADRRLDFLTFRSGRFCAVLRGSSRRWRFPESRPADRRTYNLSRSKSGQAGATTLQFIDRPRRSASRLLEPGRGFGNFRFGVYAEFSGRSCGRSFRGWLSPYPVLQHRNQQGIYAGHDSLGRPACGRPTRAEWHTPEGLLRQ